MFSRPMRFFSKRGWHRFMVCAAADGYCVVHYPTQGSWLDFDYYADFFSASRIGRKPARKGSGAEASGFMRRISSHIEKSGSSRKVGGANKGLGEAPKSCTRKEHESATNSIAKRGQGAIAPCRVKGQRPLWGLGQRPNSSTGDQYAKRAQQRCRQRSVPARNSALPQERPRAALPQRFREEQKKRLSGGEFSLPKGAFVCISRFPAPCRPPVR